MSSILPSNISIMECPAIATPHLRTETKSPHPHPHEQSKRIPHLPYDIITLLIDALRHDAPALHACTLTARAWTHRARVHLHRSLTLPVKVRGCEFVFASEEGEEKFCVMGREVPVVLRYADELNLKCVTTSSGRSVRGQGAPLSAVLSLFRHIRVLRIVDADLSTISFSSSSSESLWHTQNTNSSSWATALPNLENLTLCKTSFRSAHDVVRLAMGFRGLRTLRVEDVTVPAGHSESESDGNPSFKPLTVRDLHILNSPRVANALATSFSLSHLSRLSSCDLRKLHVDTTSHASMLKALKNAEVGSGIGIEQLHLTLQEELYPLWHVHVQGRVSNMTAPDIRAGQSPLPFSLSFTFPSPFTLSPRQCKHN
ncbi:hypothetical protein BC629DRAFT_310653 [Irpex lacteus]|nr:hypothetical protein BC629DRAFT_310653 [Irpex lacteus]